MRRQGEGVALAVSTKHAKLLFLFGHAPHFPHTAPTSKRKSKKKNGPLALSSILPGSSYPISVPLGSSCPLSRVPFSSQSSPSALPHTDLPSPSPGVILCPALVALSLAAANRERACGMGVGS